MEYMERRLREDAPKKTIARELTQRFPGVFADVENARAFIRQQTNSVGDRNRLKSRPDGRSTIREGLAKLKRQQREADEPVHIGKSLNLVLSDIHFPYHAPDAVAIAIETGLDHGCENLILNGDIVDFFGVSRFTKEIGRMSPAEELEVLREFLRFVSGLFPGRKVYKIGNHEERFRAYLLNNAKEIADMAELSFESLFQLEENGFELVKRAPIHAGKLMILHGHEFGEAIFSPVNPARGLFNRAKSSSLVGHYHQTSHHSEGNLHGDKIGCWSTGCLCDMSPDYRPYAYTKWNHGFAIVDVREDGSYRVHNKTIIGGEVY